MRTGEKKKSKKDSIGKDSSKRDTRRFKENYINQDKDLMKSVRDLFKPEKKKITIKKKKKRNLINDIKYAITKGSDIETDEYRKTSNNSRGDMFEGTFSKPKKKKVKIKK